MQLLQDLGAATEQAVQMSSLRHPTSANGTVGQKVSLHHCHRRVLLGNHRRGNETSYAPAEDHSVIFHFCFPNGRIDVSSLTYSQSV